MKESSKINIAVIDSHSVFQHFIKSILEENKHLRVIMQSASGVDFFNTYKRHSIDVILLDIDNPAEDGMYILKKLKAECGHIPVVVFSNVDSLRFHGLCYSLGVKKCISKSHLHKLQTEILELFNIPHLTAPGNQDINRDEIQLLTLICDEHSIEEIATKLKIGSEAVKKRKSKLAGKMNIACRDTQFLKWAVKRGYYAI